MCSESYIIIYYTDMGQECEEEVIGSQEDAVKQLRQFYSVYCEVGHCTAMSEPHMSHPSGNGAQYDLENDTWYPVDKGTYPAGLITNLILDEDNNYIKHTNSRSELEDLLADNQILVAGVTLSGESCPKCTSPMIKWEDEEDFCPKCDCETLSDSTEAVELDMQVENLCMECVDPDCAGCND